MRHAEGKLEDLVRSVAEPMGYELVGVEYFHRGQGGAVLRIYIDHEKGITLDDCSAVSHQLSGVLDVDDSLPGHYDLEVSSPGLERPLFTAAHYERFRGHRAHLKRVEKLEGRRNFTGKIAGVSDGEVQLVIDGEVFELPLSMIESAHLVPEF